MHPDYQQLMTEAARLTRSGELAAATTLIQRALNGSAGIGDTVTASNESPIARSSERMPFPFAASNVIDVVAREIDAPSRAERHPAVDPVGDPVANPVANSTEHRGQFVSGSFEHAAGTRAYKLYIPSAAGNGPLPLVVMLHGCTQNADDFARGTAMNQAAEQQGFFVLYPQQSRKMNAQGCWNWFKHSHQQRGRGEPALLADMARQVMSRHSVDRSRVYVAGLSAGGAMAAILGQTYPDVFAAVGVHSGLAAGAATDLPSAFAAMKGGGSGPVAPSGGSIPTIVFHGDADPTVNHRNAERVVAACIGPDAALMPSPTGSTTGSRRATRQATRQVHADAAGLVTAELWTVHGAPHAWSGGRSTGSFTDPAGPDATAEMLRFFLTHTLRGLG